MTHRGDITATRLWGVWLEPTRKRNNTPLPRNDGATFLDLHRQAICRRPIAAVVIRADEPWRWLVAVPARASRVSYIYGHFFPRPGFQIDTSSSCRRREANSAKTLARHDVPDILTDPMRVLDIAAACKGSVPAAPNGRHSWWPPHSYVHCTAR